MRSSFKVAIVHDWLVGGGAEKVVLELHKIYPDAPIYTSYCSDEWREKLDNKVVTGYLQNWPFSKLRKFLPLLRMRWFASLDLSGFDLIISSTGNGEAKFVKKPTGAKHICYCHSPVHFYWRHYEAYIKNPGFGAFNSLARLGLRLLIKPLRKLDYQAAQAVDIFIANSTHIQNDIKKYYGKDSVIIHPPVDVERFAVTPKHKRAGLITVGRLVPNKRVDIIIKACNELGLQLTVIGRGPELKSLQAIAGPTISFDSNASDEKVAEYMATAEAFLFASFEDFGITPVEAMAAGTPVIAYKAGGALDYVVAGKTGEFFDKQSSESLVSVLKLFKSSIYNSANIQQYSHKFSVENFHNNLSRYLETAKGA